MRKHILTFAAFSAIIVGNSSCKNDGGFKKTQEGVEYKIAKDEKGENAKYGDIIEFHYAVYVGDSLLFDSRTIQSGEPLKTQLMENKDPKANKAMDPTPVIAMLSPGDSAVIRMTLDSQARTLYTFAKPDDKMIYKFKMIAVKSEAQLKKEMEEKVAAQLPIDDKKLTDYFAQNNLSPQKTASGLYYIVSKPGSGENATAGKVVKMKYTGKTLAGEVFDSNIDPKFGHTDPLEFPLGSGAVIPGWDEGIALLNKGSKATFFIPSTLAYGPEGRQPVIQPNEILVFDVELLDFK